MRVPIQIHVSLCISLRSRNFFTHRAVVATSAQCFGIGTRIHFVQLRENCVSAFRGNAAGVLQTTDFSDSSPKTPIDMVGKEAEKNKSSVAIGVVTAQNGGPLVPHAQRCG